MENKQLTTEELKTALAGLPIGEVHSFERIGSTNDFALERAAAGAPDMSIVTAYEQFSGRGRMQRKWVTAPGASLPMTVIIRPSDTEMEHLNLFSPLTGLAVSEALRNDYGVNSEIKWPNDILINRKKTSGVLCEMYWEGEHLEALLLGVGVNLLKGSAPDIPDITYPATSVEDETGIRIPRSEWIRHFLEEILRIRPLLGTAEFFRLWESHLAYKNEEAMVIRPDGAADRCVVRGISTDGSLIAEMGNGERKTFLAGEISLRRAA